MLNKKRTNIMTANWFEGKVKYMAVDENGREVKKTDLYLLDALSFTEGEARLIALADQTVKGDFYITSLKKSNITDVVTSGNEADDRWFRAKIAIIDADEVSGREKKSNEYFLVAASDIGKALENLERSLLTFVVPYEIVGLNDTQFMDVIPYTPREEEAEDTEE